MWPEVTHPLPLCSCHPSAGDAPSSGRKRANPCGSYARTPLGVRWQVPARGPSPPRANHQGTGGRTGQGDRQLSPPFRAHVEVG